MDGELEHAGARLEPSQRGYEAPIVPVTVRGRSHAQALMPSLDRSRASAPKARSQRPRSPRCKLAAGHPTWGATGADSPSRRPSRPGQDAQALHKVLVPCSAGPLMQPHVRIERRDGRSNRRDHPRSKGDCRYRRAPTPLRGLQDRGSAVVEEPRIEVPVSLGRQGPARERGKRCQRQGGRASVPANVGRRPRAEIEHHRVPKGHAAHQRRRHAGRAKVWAGTGGGPATEHGGTHRQPEEKQPSARPLHDQSSSSIKRQGRAETTTAVDTADPLDRHMGRRRRFAPGAAHSHRRPP
jgi:hypothetical protein